MSFILAVFAIINLALGFFLALYLGKAPAPWAMNATPGERPAEETSPGSLIENSATDVAEDAAETTAAPAALDPAAEPATSSADQIESTITATGEESPEQAATKGADRRPRIEEPLDEEFALAGAEALRSQLAKLQPAQPAEKPVASPP